MAAVSAAKIPPGGEGEIAVKLDTRGRQGSLIKAITVYSNDPENSRILLKMSGTVEVAVAFEPSRLQFDQVVKGARLTETVALTGTKAGDVKLGAIKSTKPRQVSAKRIEVGGLQAMEVAFVAPEREGGFHAILTAETGLDQPREIQLAVAAKVTGDLVLDRSLVLLPGSDWKSPPERIVTVRSVTGKPFEILKVEDRYRTLDCEAAPSGDEWKVTLRRKSGAKAERGTIRISTDRPDQRYLLITYNVGVRTPVGCGE